MVPIKSTRTALIVTAAVILAAALFGSHRSLNALRKEALTVFSQGEYGDGIGVRSDLARRADACANLCTVAQNSGLGETPQVEALRGRVEAFRAGDSAADLTGPAQEVVDLLSGAELSEASRRDLSDLEATLDSIALRIRRDPYTDLAQTFNTKTLAAFPANVLGGLTGVKPLTVYQ